MKISLLHPSRNRAVKAHATFQNWLFNASGENLYEYIISIDNDDSQLSEYRRRFSGCTIIENNNRSLVDAVNNAAKLATGDIIIVMSDDFDCVKDWDILLCEYIEANNLTGEYAIQVDDGYSFGKDGDDANLLTIPIISIELWLRLKYIYHPSYFSMFADNDIFEVCKTLNCLYIAPHIKFQHNHYTIGKSNKDDTYDRQNSMVAWTQGNANLKQRKARNYDL